MGQNKKSIWRRRLFKILAGFLLIFVAAGLAAWFFPQTLLTVDDGPVHADAIVLLGGNVRERSARASALFKEGAAPKILVSGFGDNVANEHMLEKDGVPAADIVLEGKSHTTRENAEFSIPILRAMGARRVIIVTSWYHSRRALHTFEHYSSDIQFFSRPSYQNYEKPRSRSFNRAVKLEYIKILGYWVCYGICPF